MNLLGTAGMIFLIILNGIFMLLGLGLIIIGGHFYNKGGLIDDNILPLLNEIDVVSFTLGDLIQIVAVLVVLVGVFTFLVATSGMVGAVGKFRVVLLVYAIIVAVCAILEVTVVGFIASLIKELNNTIKSSLISALSTYDGYSTSDVITIAWNVLFLLLNCCGVNKQSEVDDFASTTWAATRGSEVIPGYCCIGATASTVTSYNGTACTNSPTTANSYVSKGCYDGLNDLLMSFVTGMVTICVLILIVEIVAIVASYIMIWQITVDEKARIKAKRQANAKVESSVQQQNVPV